MSIRSTFGIDAFDLSVHIIVTFFVMILVGLGMGFGPPVALAAVPLASLLVLAWRRKRGLPSGTPGSTGETEAARLYEHEARLGELETLQERFLELEERVDFAERLLAREAEAQRLGKGS